MSDRTAQPSTTWEIEAGRPASHTLQHIYIYIYIMNNTILRYELMSLNRLYGGVLHHYIIYAMMCVSVSNIPYKATVFE